MLSPNSSRDRSIVPLRHAASIAMIAIVFASSSQGARTILPGSDLWVTAPGTQFLGFDFEGVPPGTKYGDADTIVRRLEPAVFEGGGPAQIPIKMVELSLRSVQPIDIGFGTDFHYVTLQPDQPSLGTMDITFDNNHVTPPGPPLGTGTFNSTLNVAFDVRMGALDGPIVRSETLELSSTGTGWGHLPGENDVQIPGVNLELNGSSAHNDFWPGPTSEQHPKCCFAIHNVEPAGHAFVTDNPLLPPIGGEYLTNREVHAHFTGLDLDFILKNPRHRPAPHPSNSVSIDGPDEIEIFFTELFGAVDILAAPNVPPEALPLRDQPFYATGFARVRSLGKAGQNTGTFQTEVEQMMLRGFVITPEGEIPIQIWENHFSPSARSLGETTIRHLPGGDYAIDSTFEIFPLAGVGGSNLFQSQEQSVRVRLTKNANEFTPGDLNDDGRRNNLDITPIIQALIIGGRTGDLAQEAAFIARIPDGRFRAADANHDGSVNNLDISPLIRALTSENQSVPEPAVLWLFAAGASVFRRPKRRRIRDHALVVGGPAYLSRP